MLGGSGIIRQVTASTTAAKTPVVVPARTAELFAPGLRGLSIGLIATITLVALEALAIGTVLPLVGEELGQIELYGWVYSAFFLGNLLGVVVAGGALDRVPLWRPFAIGLALFAIGLTIGGLAPSMVVLVGRALRPGPRRRGGGPDGVRRDRPDAARAAAAADVRPAVDGVGRARRDRAVDRGARRRVHDVAAGVPGPAAAAGRGGRDGGDGPAPDPRGRAARRARGGRGDRPSAAQRAAGGRRAPAS